MNHLDLFSGIGGFAYAVDQVWPGATHVFCDNDKFCQKVLAKHWPGSKIYGDIRTITNTEYNGSVATKKAGKDSGIQSKSQTGEKLFESEFEGVGSLWTKETRWDLLTGGFPCQPFSQAGKRRGTEDDRYLWPEMLRVIQLTTPTWIIGENVPGIINIENGMVFQQVCTDLENEGYEVQPFIIPAVAVNAPHRRDRVWIVAYGGNERLQRNEGKESPRKKGQPDGYNAEYDWNQNWLEVATRFCRVDDGVSDRVDRLKALGNAIVPQVAIEIMKAIKV